jgi:hypothetical protein
MSTGNKTKPKKPISASLRARKALKLVVENGGNVSKAMRDVGFSDAYAKNPHKLTNSKAYKDILEAAGVTDDAIAKKHNILLNAARIEHQSFPGARKERTVKIINGRTLKTPKLETYYSHVDDDGIRAIIESVPGHRLLYIQKGYAEKIAYFQVPESVVQSKQIEMALKVKGHYAADKFEVSLPEPTDEENAALDNIFAKNKKK